MKISIEDKSGFCYGVVRVIEMAEELLRNGEQVWCLGQIVHNEQEVKRLSELGMNFIEHKDLHKLKNAKLLIRAHGEPPSTYVTARKNNLEIIEGTCPVVLKLQKKIRKEYEELDKENDKIIIYGKKDHPEVIGLKGQTDNKALVISKPEDIRNLKPGKKSVLFSQTTMDTYKYDQLASILISRINSNRGTLRVNKSICGHISHRKPGLLNFAEQNDVIVFVGGKKSSNAQVLFEICKSVNERSHFVSFEEEIKEEWFLAAESVGVCGATSTPLWQLENIAKRIDKFTKI